MESIVENKKVALIIASEGYHQVEYTVPKNMLEKDGVTVITVSNKPGGAVAKDKSTTDVDCAIDTFNFNDVDGIFFIGGPGALEHLDNPKSYHLISQAKKLGKPYGAICISVRILAKAYGLEGKKATGWNGDNALETILTEFGATYSDHPIVTDGLVVTATGPESAEQFGQGIQRVLRKEFLNN